MERNQRTILWRKLVGVSLLALSAAGLVYAGAVYGGRIIAFISDGTQFRAWAKAQGIWGRFAMMGIMAVQIILAFLPGEPVEIAAGFAFGPVEGAVLCLAGAAAGSAVVFFLVRLLGMRVATLFITKEKFQSISFMRSTKCLHLLTFVLFFIPGSPKDVLTYFMGLTPMKAAVFLPLSTAARIPSVFTSTVGGSAMGEGNFWFAALVFGATALISLGGIWAYRQVCKREKGEAQGPLEEK